MALHPGLPVGWRRRQLAAAPVGDQAVQQFLAVFLQLHQRIKAQLFAVFAN